MSKSAIGESQQARENKIAREQEEARNQAKHNREVAEREQKRANEGKGKANPLTPNAPATETITTEGVPTPTPEPFLTAEDLEQYAEAREQYELGLKGLDENYEQTKHNDEYETAEIEKGRVGSVENENWDAASRGLFQSSIRDGDLADIDATAEIKKKFLSDSLASMAVYNEGQKKIMEAKWGRYEEAKNRKAVENAEGVSATLPQWEVEPTTKVVPVTAATKSNNNAPVKKNTFVVGGAINTPKSGSSTKNGGTTAPAGNPSITPGHAVAHAQAATKAVYGNIYGKK